MPLSVNFRTFGCKLNQLETEALASAFAHAGATVSNGLASAQVHVFNTCTVTGKAEQKARREIRQLGRLDPAALILVTGCYAQVEAASLAALSPRVLVVSAVDKSLLLSLAGELASAAADQVDLYDHARSLLARQSDLAPDPFAFAPDSFHFHSRPSLKIQDGCNNRCTYCRVCIARGPSVSLDSAMAVQRVQALEQAGAAEVVLTGVNLSQYRADGVNFTGLVRLLLRETSTIRVRLSSWEPDQLGDDFLDMFALPRVQPHLHLAVQSGSDSVLQAMGRRYRRTAVLDGVQRLRAVRSDPFIGADLICGFPGETEALFAETLALAEAAEFAWIHAFTFSPRPDTLAASLPQQIAPGVAAERTARLTNLATTGRKAFCQRRLATESLAILENQTSLVTQPLHSVAFAPVQKWRTAVSNDYLKLAVFGVPAGIQGLVTVVIDSGTNQLPAGCDLSARFQSQ